MIEKTINIEELDLHFEIEEGIWRTKVRKSDTKVTDLRQLDLLAEAADRFVPAEVREGEDHLHFDFATAPHERTWEQVIKLNKADRLRLLSNMSVFFGRLPARLTYFFHPDNLVFDENLMPRILYRGIRQILPPYEMNEDRLLEQYKCLAVAIFSKKFTFDQLYNGSLAEANETEFERKTAASESLDALSAYLKESYLKEQKKMDRTMVLVPEKRFKLFKWLAFSMIAAAIFLAVPLGYFLFVKSPFDEKLLEAHQSNLAEEQDGVIAALKDIDPEKMPQATKYILASAYVKTERLSLEEKQVILKNISLKSEPNYLLYWIYNGRGEFDKSIDLAKLLDDPRLTIYGLIKKIEQDKNDPELTGEERDQKVSASQQKLEKLRKDYGLDEEEEEADSELAPEAEKKPDTPAEADQKKQAEKEEKPKGKEEKKAPEKKTEKKTDKK